jgi:cyclic patellamide precursor peptide PatG
MANLNGTERAQAAAAEPLEIYAGEAAEPKPAAIPGPRPFVPSQTETEAAPPQSEAPNGATASYIYALGRIDARFPSLAVEKEFSQATGRADTAGLTDRRVLQQLLSERANRYLARRLCWVFSVESLDTYILQPEDPSDVQMLVESIRPSANPADIDVIIGVRGPVAPPAMCNGLTVPIVMVSQVYSFERAAFLKTIPKPEKMEAKQFAPASQELFDRIIQLADNAGATDEHRALNYLAVRYPAIYAQATESFANNRSLTSVEVRPSRLSGARRIVQVIFTYTDRQTDVTDRYFCRVDVTEEFPFLFSKLAPFYDRW